MFSKVSIIIPALNEERYIGQCLQSLLNLDRSNMEVELIVVDNGSTDRTIEIAQQYGTTLVIKPGLKVAALRNFGVSLSKGDLLAFVDADCTVSKEWLNQAIQCIVRESVDAVGSFHIIPEDAGWIGRSAELTQRKKVGSEINYIPSGNMLVKRASFCSVGGFDESLETAEDVDLSHRLRGKGYKLFIDPKICSIHWGHPKSIKELFFRELWHGKTTLTVFLRDLQAVRNLRLIFYSGINLILIMSMAVGLFLLFSGRWPLFIFSFISYLFLNLTVTALNWLKVKEGFLGLFNCTLVYGLARSMSMLNWFTLNIAHKVNTLIKKNK